MDHAHKYSALSLAQHAARLHMLLDQRIIKVLNSHGLSRGELDVLGALAASNHAEARPRELSSRLLLTTGGLSNILRRLQEDGLIERQADNDDARSRVVHLTPRGKAAAKQAGLEANEAISRLLDRVDTATLDDAAQMVHRVLAAIDEDSPVHRQRHDRSD